MLDRYTKQFIKETYRDPNSPNIPTTDEVDDYMYRLAVTVWPYALDLIDERSS